MVYIMDHTSRKVNGKTHYAYAHDIYYDYGQSWMILQNFLASIPHTYL